MDVCNLVQIIGSDFYTGVPDSQLKALCDYLMNTYSVDPCHHIITANEGNAVALAAGYHLATGKIPVVYLQNSGEGNIANPVISLLNEKVYAIPTIFIVGWRGEPQLKDEPQHIFQGEITCEMLKVMGIEFFFISKKTTTREITMTMDRFKIFLKRGKQVAFVVGRDSLTYAQSMNYCNGNILNREEVIRHIVKASGNGLIITTTGKASRELFEIREENEQSHEFDFLTVGSMGHASSIALGVALNKPDKKVWCIDGDGAALMHMGAMPVISSCHPANLVHIIINNGSHESVGGQPTVMKELNFWEIGRDCGYPFSVCANDLDSLDRELDKVKRRNGLTLIEVKCRIGSRSNLGRPTTSTIVNKESFISFLKNSK